MVKGKEVCCHIMEFMLHDAHSFFQQKMASGKITGRGVFPELIHVSSLLKKHMEGTVA